MNVYGMLKRDHSRLRSLLRALARTTERSPAARRRLWEDLSTLLLDHASCEETYLYPELASHGTTQPLVSAAREEHYFARVLIESLESLSFDDPRWASRFAVLRENIEHHARTEERDLFPRARQVMDSALATSLGGLIARARGTRRTQSHRGSRSFGAAS